MILESRRVRGIVTSIHHGLGDVKAVLVEQAQEVPCRVTQPPVFTPPTEPQRRTPLVTQRQTVDLPVGSQHVETADPRYLPRAIQDVVVRSWALDLLSSLG